MTRKETYLKALAMQKRVEELQVMHKWDARDLSFVQLATDELLPIALHVTGKNPLLFL